MPAKERLPARHRHRPRHRIASEQRLIRLSFSWLSFFNEGADHGDLI
jgi:hypothetical protein